jgi:hypothetical protein
MADDTSIATEEKVSRPQRVLSVLPDWLFNRLLNVIAIVFMAIVVFFFVRD